MHIAFFLFAYWDRRPITDDIYTGNASVYYILSYFSSFNTAIADILM